MRRVITVLILILLFVTSVGAQEPDCEGLESFEIGRCYSQLARERLDENLCEHAYDLKDGCYKDIAILTSNPQLCVRVSSSGIIKYRDLCYRDVASRLDDQSVCEKIKDRRTRNECFFQTSINLDKGFGKSILFRVAFFFVISISLLALIMGKKMSRTARGAIIGGVIASGLFLSTYLFWGSLAALLVRMLLLAIAVPYLFEAYENLASQILYVLIGAGIGALIGSYARRWLKAAIIAAFFILNLIIALITYFGLSAIAD